MNVCACDRPLGDKGDCMKCGKPLKPPPVKRGPKADHDERRLAYARSLRKPPKRRT